MTDAAPFPPPEVGERLLEQHLQYFVAQNLESIARGVRLSLIGREVPTGAGRIDVLAREEGGRHWVIETKIGMATRDAVAQLQSYLAATRELESFAGHDPIGILLAESFDTPCMYALQLAPSVRAVRYSVAFAFESDASAGTKKIVPNTARPEPWIVDLERQVFFPKGLRQSTFSLANRMQVAEHLGEGDVEIYLGSRKLGRYRRVGD